MSTEKVDVIIVGAGVSGLVAALELGKQGLSTAIVDKDSQVGGRVQSDEADGFIFDRGFQVLLTAYPEARRYLDYDALELCRFPRGASILTTDAVIDLADPRDNAAAALKTFGKVFHARDLPGLWRLSRVKGSPDPEDDSAAADYIGAANFSDSLRTGFLEPFLRGILLDEKLEAPVQQVSFYLEMFAKGYAAVPARGMHQLPRNLADQLTNCQLLLGKEVTAIEPNGIGFADGTSLAGSALVLALDGYQAARLIGQDCPGDFHATVCHYFDVPADELDHLKPLVLNGRQSGPINHLSIPSHVSDHYAPAGRTLLGANTIGSQSSAPLSAIEDQLQSWFGRQAAQWRHLRSVEIPQALPAQGQQIAWQRLAEQVATAAQTAFNGPTAVAGDYTATASLNGAMASGAKAAQTIAGH